MEAITRSRAAAAEDQAYAPVGTNTNPIETMPSSPAAPAVATSGEDL
jgi:osmoprotectant transport system ATP-binding protein